MAKRPSFALNFRFVGNAQTGQVSRQGANQLRGSKGRFTKIDDFARTVVEDVALNTASRTFDSAKSAIETRITAVVQREIQRMATYIGRFSVQPNNARGPKGTVTSAQQVISDQARSIWGNKDILYYDVGRSDVSWKPRTKRYMNWKRENYGEDWWKNTGSLRKALSSEDLYKDLGPIKVTFQKGGTQPKGPAKQTSSGRSGNVSNTYQIGKLDVAFFGRVTPDMLPALMDSLNGGITHATPSGAGGLIPNLFKSANKEVWGKLMSHGNGEYRPVVEPFLAYYMTRAIPNAIFNRTEKLIEDSAARASRMGGGRKGDTNMDFFSTR